MNEKLLQYLWNFKIFNNFDFKDVQGNTLEMMDFGKWNFDSGPDFLYGKIKFQGLILAGNIELHVKSSDYIFHRHSGNPEFENLILHAVYFHDTEVEELNQKNIPTLELREYIDQNILHKYESLLSRKTFIPCENIFTQDKIPFGFTEETLLKKLDAKSLEVEQSLQRNTNNYEAVLFQNLAYAFGLKVNANIFRELAENIDFTVLNKVRQNLTQLEALFFGLCGWLDKPADEQMRVWKREYDFLVAKYQIPKKTVLPKFSKLRPPNFPTIRLSQLAHLYHSNQNLFSKFMTAKTTQEITEILADVKASSYWDERFNFGKTSTVNGEKVLSEGFTHLIITNAILPLRYTYRKNTDENILDDILTFYRSISPEQNTVTDNWKLLGAPVNNALQSQAFIYHYSNFCQPKRCLDCPIGLQLLRNNG